LNKKLNALLASILRRTRGINRLVVVLLIAAGLGLRTYVGADQSQLADYDDARRVFWSTVYADGGETLYCGYKFQPGDTRKLNIEHIVPMAWATRTLKCGTRKQCRRNSPEFNRLEGDLHNLYPSLRKINDERGSLRFGIISGEKRKYGACDFEVDFRTRIVEPRPEVRGDIARAMFYMHQRYGIEIFSKLGRQLLQWHEQFPPTDEDKRRNDVIESVQGTRNGFIDDPNRASSLGF